MLAIDFFSSACVCSGPPKQKKDDKKKKRPNPHAGSEKKKKIKIESTEVSQPRPGSMNEKDKEALKSWKEFKKASHVGRNGTEEDIDKMMMIQQQQLMRRQIEEQALVIGNQQKIIQEQLQYIGVLKEQKQTLLRECQQAGLSTSDIPALQTPSKVTAQHFSLPLPHMSYPPPSQLATHPLSQPQPPSPSQTVSSAPMSKQLPPRPPSYPSHPPPPPLLPPSHQSLLSHIRVTPGVLPQQPPPPPPPPPPCAPAPCNFPGLPPTSQPPPRSQLPTSVAQPSSLQPLPPIYDACNRTPSLPESLTFSPLTSSEFREIEHKDQPPGYSAVLLRSYDEELNSILDIAGLPTGRGAGYGVGVADDELPALDLRYVCVPVA